MPPLYMFFLGYFQFGFLKGRWASLLERVGKADIRYFSRLGLVALAVITMGLEILLTPYTFLYCLLRHPSFSQQILSSR